MKMRGKYSGLRILYEMSSDGKAYYPNELHHISCFHMQKIIFGRYQGASIRIYISIPANFQVNEL
jgi:hypothetical protein